MLLDRRNILRSPVKIWTTFHSLSLIYVTYGKTLLTKMKPTTGSASLLILYRKNELLQVLVLLIFTLFASSLINGIG